ncbi:hypothetical protein Ancab_033668 [Ancistrocladus abbreviatus]
MCYYMNALHHSKSEVGSNAGPYNLLNMESYVVYMMLDMICRRGASEAQFDLLKILKDIDYSVGFSNIEKKISHLTALKDLGDLRIFQVDLKDSEESFVDAFEGCDVVFHVATPVNFASEDPELCKMQNDIIKPAVQGVLNVLKASMKVKSVKGVIKTLQGIGLVMNEDNWTDVEFLYSKKPPTWGYLASKTLAEKAT